MKKIVVPLKNRSYPIFIDNGALGQLRPLLKKKQAQKIVILTNSTLNKLYGHLLKKQVSKYEVCWITIPDGEKYKNSATLEKIYKQLAQKKIDRKTILITFGGGVVGDIGGFIAATYLRGIPYIQIPTTLLAQVDSSVGGKTGIDLPYGKNLVGAFYQPQAVIIDTKFLKTLPRREYLCGLAEVIKYGLLGNALFFRYIEKNHSLILKKNSQVLKKLIATSCAMKAHIVGHDEKESGLRSLLNLGHTLAHSIETLTNYSRIHHGEAVAMGLGYSALFSLKKGWLTKEEHKRILGLLKKLNLPTQWPKLNRKKYQHVLSLDKKAVGKKINYVALKKIGKAFLIPLTVEEITKFI